GPALVVFGMSPGQRELRLHHALVIKRGECVENRRRGGSRGRIEHADLERIETGNIELEADSGAAALLLGTGGACKQSDAKCRDMKYLRKRARADCRFHLVLPPK